MRRRVGGVGAIQKQQFAQARFKDKGTELAADQLLNMTKQMESFREKLQGFAAKHKREICKNSDFREQFQAMCAAVGVDPLASSKGFWANILGVGNFYYELGVQIIEVCLATRQKNGGIMDLEDLRLAVAKSRQNVHRQEDISRDDMLRAIDKLKVFGEGFRVIASGKDHIVQSVPAELNVDHTKIIQNASETGFVSVASLKTAFDWTEQRAEKAIQDLIREGMIWIDEQPGKETTYWFPGLQKSKPAAAL